MSNITFRKRRHPLPMTEDEYKMRRAAIVEKCGKINFSALSDEQLWHILEIANNPELLEEGEK